MRLRDADLRLRDLKLGGIDAESDYNLADYFVTTPYVESAIAGRRTLFLGRKGSGKSGLFTQLPRLLNEGASPDVAVLLLTPDHYAWAALKEYREQGLLSDQAHTNAWKLTLAIEIAAKLVSLDDNWVGSSEGAIKALRRFLSDNYGTAEPGLTRTATSILEGLSKFNFSAFGFGVGVEQRQREELPITPTIVASLFDVIESIVHDQAVVVALDRLDDSWDGSPESQSLIIGLLKAAKELNDRFGHTDGGLRVLVFLRSDIYDSLRFDDKDKHRPTEEHIIWRPDELKEMLGRRLPSRITVDELFEPGDMRGSIAPFNYISKRTFLRPREILQFMEECIRQAGGDAIEITKDNVREAEERYSRWKVDDLKQEYSAARRFFDIESPRPVPGLRARTHEQLAVLQLGNSLRYLQRLPHSFSTARMGELYGPVRGPGWLWRSRARHVSRRLRVRLRQLLHKYDGRRC